MLHRDRAYPKDHDRATSLDTTRVTCYTRDTVMLYLTSSVARVARHLYTHHLAEFGYRSVLFVDTAAEPELGGGDDDWFYNDISALEDLGYQVERFTVTGMSREDVARAIDTHDVLYVSGGNTAHLLTELQKSDSLTLIEDRVEGGKPYIATSAGAIIAGPRIPDYLSDEVPSLDDRTALDLIPVTIVPHWGSEDFRDAYLGGRIEAAYREDQPPFLLMSNTQYAVVDEHKRITIVDTLRS